MDIKIIKEFALKASEKLANNELNNVEILRKDAYRDYKNMPIVSFTNECKCSFCLDCATACPVGAIPEDDQY